MQDLIARLPVLIGSAVEANPLMGYVVIAAVMLLENVFPPIPSELVMPLGGFYVQQGKLELVPVILAGLIGTVLGAWFWYGIGRLINEQRIERWLDRHGRWIGISAADLNRSRRWFLRHGTAVVFWGRIIPGVRTLVSVPAGIELMPQLSFLAWTTAGSLVWVVVLTLLGQGLGQGYQTVELWIDPFSKLVKILLILAVLVAAGWIGLRVIRQQGRR
ncbi:MAG: DedA family protein [Cyanobacteriota bacterium]|nr:DedA family protein [Cyanobacteriota bacterium]